MMQFLHSITGFLMAHVGQSFCRTQGHQRLYFCFIEFKIPRDNTVGPNVFARATCVYVRCLCEHVTVFSVCPGVNVWI